MHSSTQRFVRSAVLASCISLAMSSAASARTEGSTALDHGLDRGATLDWPPAERSPEPSIREDQRSHGIMLVPASTSAGTPSEGWEGTSEKRALVLIVPRHQHRPKKPARPKRRPNWDAIARCESGGRWHYNGPSGFDGGLQFLPSTWTAVMRASKYWFARYAYQATRAQQIAAAEYLIGPMRADPWTQWPYCWRFAWKRS